MGKVVQMTAYREAHCSKTLPQVDDSKVPIEFAVGKANRDSCLQTIARYGIGSVLVRRLNNDPGSMLYLIGISDAIWLNKRMLEREELSDDEIARHIDIIQMLENLDLVTMEQIWASFTVD